MEVPKTSDKYAIQPMFLRGKVIDCARWVMRVPGDVFFIPGWFVSPGGVFLLPVGGGWLGEMHFGSAMGGGREDEVAGVGNRIQYYCKLVLNQVCNVL